MGLSCEETRSLQGPREEPVGGNARAARPGGPPSAPACPPEKPGGRGAHAPQRLWGGLLAVPCLLHMPGLLREWQAVCVSAGGGRGALGRPDQPSPPLTPVSGGRASGGSCSGRACRRPPSARWTSPSWALGTPPTPSERGARLLAGGCPGRGIGTPASRAPARLGHSPGPSPHRGSPVWAPLWVGGVRHGAQVRHPGDFQGCHQPAPGVHRGQDSQLLPHFYRNTFRETVGLLETVQRQARGMGSGCKGPQAQEPPWPPLRPAV